MPKSSYTKSSYTKASGARTERLRHLASEGWTVMGGTSEPRRMTRGDAEAVFEAFGGGGRSVLQHSRVGRGAPADSLGSHCSIRPFAGSDWDGAHFCEQDWHVILIADIEGGDSSFTRQNAESIMQGLQITFTLDGNPLPTTRTAIKRFLSPDMFDLQSAFYFQQGRIMSPTDLSIGSHRLDVAMSDASGPVFQDGITFFIDAANTGACV